MLLPSMKLVRARNVVVAAGMAVAVAVAAAVVTGAVAVAAIAAAAAAADAGNVVTKECFSNRAQSGGCARSFFRGDDRASLVPNNVIAKAKRCSWPSGQ